MHNQSIFQKYKEKKKDNTAPKNKEHVLPKSGSLLRATGMKPKSVKMNGYFSANYGS